MFSVLKDNAGQAAVTELRQSGSIRRLLNKILLLCRRDYLQPVFTTRNGLRTGLLASPASGTTGTGFITAAF